MTKLTPAKHLAARLDTIHGSVAVRFGLPTGTRPAVQKLPVPGRRGGAYFAVSAQTSQIIGHRLGFTAADAIEAIDRALAGAR